MQINLIGATIAFDSRISLPTSPASEPVEKALHLKSQSQSLSPVY